jgi:hypothetical protein
LVALVTLNSWFAEGVADPEFIPELLPADSVPGAEALAVALAELPVLGLAFGPVAVALSPGCPVTCTSFPIMVRTASRLPVNL